MWPRRSAGQRQERALYARTNGNLRLNDPDQIIWLGSDNPLSLINSDATAEALPIVTRATSLITGPLTAAPFRIQQAGLGAPAETSRWLSDPMLLRPDSRFVPSVFPAVNRLGRSDFWATFLRSAIWWGMGAFICQEDANGEPLAGTLRLIHPQLLTTERDSDGALCWQIGADPDPVKFDRDGYVNLGPITYRVVVLRNPHSTIDYEGMTKGVFAQSPEAFGLAGQVDSYAAGTFRTGVPAGFIKVNSQGFTQEKANELKAAWMAAHGGDTRSIAILNSQMDFTPLSLSPVDAALGEMKRLSTADVAYAFGLDPMTLGVTLSNSSTYQNVRDGWSNHRDFGLSPWISSLQDTLSALLSGDRTVTVALDGFANPPAKERYASYKVAIDAGIMTPDEVRELEGLPPLPPSEAPPPPLQLAPEPQEPENEIEESS